MKNDEDEIPEDAIVLDDVVPGKALKKDGPFHLNVNVEIDIAAIICAVLLPPTIGAVLAFVASAVWS